MTAGAPPRGRFPGGDFLAWITARKREEVAEARRKVPLEEMEVRAAMAPPVRDFLGVLRQAPPVPVIAEVKLASPSRGALRGRDQGSPGELARLYREGGAAAISVLTDPEFFNGSLEDLAQVRRTVDLPVLRKDFIVDVYQVLEARAAGADAVLLIAGSLEDGELKELYHAAEKVGIISLVEVHTTGELERVLTLGAPLIGVNNRDLRTLELDHLTIERLAPLVPPDRLVVSASGIKDPADVRRVWKAGARAILVGETLVTGTDPREEVKRLCKALA